MKFVYILFLFFICSCTKEKDETWFAFKNNTGNDLVCKLYPVAKDYNYDLTKFIAKDDELSFFITDGHKTNPTGRMLELYDSIHIILQNADSTTLSFSPIKMKHYTDNLFTEADSWIQKTFKTSYKSSFHSTKVNVLEYTFRINSEMIIQDINK